MDGQNRLWLENASAESAVFTNSPVVGGVPARARRPDADHHDDSGTSPPFSEHKRTVRRLTTEALPEYDDDDIYPETDDWLTAREVMRVAPEKVSWLWNGYLALGTVNEFDALAKAGKTTILGKLIRSITAGQPFLGLPTTKSDVVYLTEEGFMTLGVVIRRSGLTRNDNVHFLSLRASSKMEWGALIRTKARKKLLETGAKFLVIDTLTKWAGLKGEDENKSGVAAAIMLPLQALATDLDVCILVVRHERGEGGEIGVSGRGSTQWAGDMDVIMRLQKVGGKTPRRRKLHATGRFDETPEELVIELGENGDYVVIGADEEEKGASRAVFDIMTDEPVPMSKLYGALEKDGYAHSTVHRAVKELVRIGRLQEADERNPETGRMRKVVSIRSVQPNGGLE